MKYIKYLITIISLLLSSYLIIELKNINILPNKYLIIISIILLLLNTIGIITLLLKNKWIKIITTIIYIILLLINITGLYYINNTKNFFKNGFNNNNLEIKKYNVLVLKTSKYQKIEELTNIGYLNNVIESKAYLNQIDIKEKQEYIRNINNMF